MGWWGVSFTKSVHLRPRKCDNLSFHWLMTVVAENGIGNGPHGGPFPKPSLCYNLRKPVIRNDSLGRGIRKLLRARKFTTGSGNGPVDVFN